FARPTQPFLRRGGFALPSMLPREESSAHSRENITLFQHRASNSMIIRIQISSRWVALSRWTSHLLVSAGSLMMAMVLWTQIDSALYQSVQARHFEAEIRKSAVIEPEYLRASPSESRSSRIESIRRPAPVLGHLDPMIVGRLEVPRLGLIVMVREGVEPMTLRKAIGHLPGTALPGEPGNFVAVGARGSSFPRVRVLQNTDES